MGISLSAEGWRVAEEPKTLGGVHWRPEITLSGLITLGTVVVAILGGAFGFGVVVDQYNQNAIATDRKFAALQLQVEAVAPSVKQYITERAQARDRQITDLYGQVDKLRDRVDSIQGRQHGELGLPERP